MSQGPDDPFHLARFVAAQELSFDAALEELRGGRKRTHWMWFIFPQVAGLGTSQMAVRYAIQSRAEGAAYLAHPVLGSRLTKCAEALLSISGKTATEVMGQPDDVKLRSSMTLFAVLSPPGSLFARVIDRYYAGELDPRTIAFLAGQ